MIDFRYHLVSIVAVFLALAIGIVLGSTELQGSTLDGLRSSSNSLSEPAERGQRAARRAPSSRRAPSDAFLQTAEPKLLNGMLTGDKIVLVTEPGAPSAVIDGIEKAAGYAGATVTGTVALQPKFNDLSGATRSSLSAINTDLATTDGTGLAPSRRSADRLPAGGRAADRHRDPEPGRRRARADRPPGAEPAGAYAKSGYLTTSGTPWNRATLAVIVAPQAVPADGPNDPANQVLLAVAAQFAGASAATLVAGPGRQLSRVGERDLRAAQQQRLRPGLQRGQRGHHARPDLDDLGPRRPAGRRQAEQLRYLGRFRGQPGTVACAERDADGPQHADTEGDGKGQEDREHEVKSAARPSLPVWPAPPSPAPW